MSQPEMPHPLCHRCFSDAPKLRKVGDGIAELLCDECWLRDPRSQDARAEADTLRQRLKILCNTIASGEANEAECYRQIAKLGARLEALNV